MNLSTSERQEYKKIIQDETLQKYCKEDLEAYAFAQVKIKAVSRLDLPLIEKFNEKTKFVINDKTYTKFWMIYIDETQQIDLFKFTELVKRL